MPLSYLVHLGTPGFMGYHIPGSEVVLIRTRDDFLFVVRPKTPDLEYAALIPEYYEITKWFLPNAGGLLLMLADTLSELVSKQKLSLLLNHNGRYSSY